jgi:hypothetical protein
LLGAGPALDVDLSRLAETFTEIHLVDIDPSAVGRAVTRQSAETRARLHKHAPVDLAPFSKRRLVKWKRSQATPDEIELAAATSLQSLLARLPWPFDVVASTCVLTQLSFDLLSALGDGHPLLPAARLALMKSHLRALVGMTADGGNGLLVSDLVSSTTYPVGDLSAESDLGATMRRIIDEGGCYFASNPDVLRSLLDRDEFFDGRVGGPDLLEPWVWTGQHQRSYLVYAMRLPR